MKKTLPARMLPMHPDLDQLKRQAKELLDAFLVGKPEAVTEVAARYPGVSLDKFALHDAQFVLARAYGFQSWPKLKAYVGGASVKHLRDSIREDDSEQVRHLLRLRPEMINAKISDLNDRPLHYAVADRNPTMVRLLLEFGADPHTGMDLDSTNVDPLTLARERGYDEIVALISEFEQRRGRPELGKLPAPATLIEMLPKGDECEIIGLLESRPDLINSADPQNGVTPLHYASAHLLEKTANWLLSHGASVDARSIPGNTPVDVVGKCSSGTEEQVQSMRAILLRAGSARTAGVAVAEGNADWLWARHKEATLGNPFYGENGLLSLAVKYDRPEILTLLLDLGFDPDERHPMNLEPPQDSWGQPLRHCVVAGKLAMAETLLARGADPNGRVWASSTPLCEAYGNPAMWKLFGRYGGCLDAELIGCLRLTEKAKELLADGVAGEAIPGSPHSRSTVAEILMQADHEGMLRIALPHVTRAPDDKWWLQKLRDSRCGSVECFRLVLERCRDLVCIPDFTMLGDIARPWPQPYKAKEREKQAALLLDAGASLSTRDSFHKTTPLGVACRWGRVELVKLYLERGADLVEADTEPWARPLALAEKYGHRRIANTLRENGAK